MYIKETLIALLIFVVLWVCACATPKKHNHLTDKDRAELNKLVNQFPL